MKKVFYLLFATIFVLSACDEIDDPFPAFGGFIDPELGITADEVRLISWDTTFQGEADQTKRNILLEEFTGHTCIFCPAGTREIVRLDSLYGAQLTPIGIHAGSFAVPDLEDPDGKFATDFRVDPFGQTYLNNFNPDRAYPRGSVSRLTAQAVGKDKWEVEIQNILNDAPKISVNLQTSYDDSLSAVRATIDYRWLEAVDGQYNLQIFVVEDNIIDWQKDGGQTLENYNHRHVLRKVVNSTWGIEVTTDGASPGDQGDFEYVFAVDRAWDPKESEVIIFVFKNDGVSYEVLQVNEAHIK